MIREQLGGESLRVFYGILPPFGIPYYAREIIRGERRGFSGDSG